MRTSNNVHLTYCTNIHPGQDWVTTFDSLKKHVPEIKSRVAPDTSFGLGLRLSNKASEQLGMDGKLIEFKKWLSDHGVYVFTMNGFPYGNFHDERVKDKVHAPDWTTRKRLDYTKRLFDQLAVLLPEGMQGGISTSPISYKHWHTSESATKEVFKKGAENLTEILLHLYHLEAKTGKYLHLDIEPEPDGMLENSDGVVRFFADYLIPIAKPILEDQLGIEADAATELIHRYITVCYDICHFSLAFEAPKDTFTKLAAARIKVGKIQVSAALKIRSDDVGNDRIWEALALFNEPTYLHQVTEKSNGAVTTYSDLPEVLQKKNPFKELRAHFHVPIFLERFDVLDSTQDQILKVLDYLKQHPVSEHLEIETYTWDVLPAGLKKDLSESIVREIQWLMDKF
ncbi:metabolite traffic protein EboE [Pricia sp. S334]|uniref:Metabolite traffic protein EboE n=1 Tax=Pricia mediterranea TaxID=3076079 RepID=A0ABU3L0Q0_9FLAO|nr:metabolite traffic protein EboE [Pricia sp. S334]MDT7827300.1 metabolite traffic protein EboE [Pricia sp. S334]